MKKKIRITAFALAALVMVLTMSTAMAATTVTIRAAGSCGNNVLGLGRLKAVPAFLLS